MNTSPKPWTQEYLRAAIRDEVGMAKLLGYTVAMPSVFTAVTELIPTKKRGYQFLAPTTSHGALPAWRRSWNAAGPLSTTLGLTVSHDQDEGTVSAGSDRRRSVTESYADHPSVDAATMAAIVRAAIRKLECQLEQ